MMKTFMRVQKASCNDDITALMRSIDMSVIGYMLIAATFRVTEEDLNIMQ